MEKSYRDLLVKFTPKVIETEREYESYLASLEELTFVKNTTREESRTLHNFAAFNGSERNRTKKFSGDYWF